MVIDITTLLTYAHGLIKLMVTIMDDSFLCKHMLADLVRWEDGVFGAECGGRGDDRAT